MIAILNGKPLISIDGDLSMEPRKTDTLSLREPLKSAMRTVPTIVVVRQVRPNRIRFTHGNGRTRSSANIAGSGNVLSMRSFDVRLQRLQVFAGLKSHCFSGRDVHFGACARISPDPG